MTTPMQQRSVTRSMALVRELVRTYQAFEQLSSSRIRSHGLTPPQFDVIATLGNTPGMSCKELSSRTLITKGTLTGVLDRLLDKGLISRRVDANDRRSLFVALTAEGDSVFRATFPDVTGHCDGAFDAMSDEELKQITATLAGLRLAITAKLEP